MKEENKIIKNYYNKLASDYDSFYKDNISKAENKLVGEIIKKDLSKNDKVLDLCCGTGLFLEITRHKQSFYTGIDFSNRMLEIASKKHQGAKFIEADLKKMIPDKKYNFVSALFCTNLELDENDIKELLKMSLEKGGKFLVMLPSKFSLANISQLIEDRRDHIAKNDIYQIRNCSRHTKPVPTTYFSSKEIREAFSKDFSNLKIQGFNFRIEAENIKFKNESIRKLAKVLKGEMEYFSDFPDLGFYLVISGTRK